jgi:hypothetical protein
MWKGRRGKEKSERKERERERLQKIMELAGKDIEWAVLITLSI